MATTAYGSEDRLEAVEAVALAAVGRCDDAAVAYIWQAVVGLADLEMRGSLQSRALKLGRELAQYVQDSRESLVG
jgi:hypothetical protein